MNKISKNLWALFWTQFFGALNDNVFKNSLVILITYQGISLLGVNSSALVALSGGVFILPFFFLSATSGQLADRIEKTKLVRIIKKIEVIIACLAIMGLMQKNYPLLLFVLLLFGLHSTFFGPLKYSLIPVYSQRDQLVFSNALISSGTFIAILLGTILGGVAATPEGSMWSLKLLLLGFALIGLFFGTKLTPEEVSISTQVMPRVDWNFWSATRDILTLIFKNSLIGILIIGLSWFWFLGAGLLSLLPLLAKNIFLGNEHVATLMLFTFTAGMGIGPFVLAKLSKGKVIRALIPLSLVIISFFIFDISVLINKILRYSGDLQLQKIDPRTIEIFLRSNLSYRVLLDLFGLAFFGGIFTVPQFAELQRISSSLELSRIIAGNNILNALAMVSVSVLLMILHQLQFSLSLIFGIIGVLNLVMCMILIYYYRSEFNKFWNF